MRESSRLWVQAPFGKEGADAECGCLAAACSEAEVWAESNVSPPSPELVSACFSGVAGCAGCHLPLSWSTRSPSPRAGLCLSPCSTSKVASPLGFVLFLRTWCLGVHILFCWFSEGNDSTAGHWLNKLPKYKQRKKNTVLNVRINWQSALWFPKGQEKNCFTPLSWGNGTACAESPMPGPQATQATPLHVAHSSLS